MTSLDIVSGTTPQLLKNLSVSPDRESVTVEFTDATYTFHAQWLHDAKCDSGASRSAASAFCAQNTTHSILAVAKAGAGINASMMVSWDDGTRTGFPAPWLRVMAPIVARQHAAEPSAKPELQPGWLAASLSVPEFAYRDIYTEDTDRFDYVKSQIFENLLLESATGIIKITGLPTPDFHAERSQKDNLVTRILKKLFGGVFQHPMRGTDETFKVSTNYEPASKRAVELPNYNTDEVLLPHVDHAHYGSPARVQGFYGLEGQSENTFVSAWAALATLKEESPGLFEQLCSASMVIGRVAQFYNPPLIQSTVDTAVTMQPGFPNSIKRIRWHPHLTGSLLTPFDTYPRARLAHQKFQEIMRRPTHQLTALLKPGDLYLWDNFRILHGRERVLEVPRTALGQTVPEQVLVDEYRAMNIKWLKDVVEEKWLVHVPDAQLHEMVKLTSTGPRAKNTC